jgi:phospholipase C
MYRRTLMVAVSAAAAAVTLYACGGSDSNNSSGSVQNRIATATPIKHVVVIYNENVSFDHYFATYPNAANPAGEPAFTPAAGTPAVNGLSGALLTANPNLTNTANGAAAANPFRLDRTQAATADQNHAYTPEQQAYDNGAADLSPNLPAKVRAVVLALSARLAR